MKQRAKFAFVWGLSLILVAGPVFTLANGKTLTVERTPSTRRERATRAPLPARKTKSKSSQDITVLGRTTTELPDGKLLLIGGVGPDGQSISSSISDPRNSETVLLNDKALARAWHSATMLPDGRVLIVGGIGSDGEVVQAAGLFDPERLVFEALPVGAITPRAYHTATLLIDGRVLLVGGVSTKTRALLKAELWNFKAQVSTTVTGKPSGVRLKGKSTLLADGNVLIEDGSDENGKELRNNELFNLKANSFNFTSLSSEVDSQQVPFLTGSLPQEGATEVELDTLIGLRFSKPLSIEGFNPETLTIARDGNRIAAKVILAEGGRLAFISPLQGLQEGVTYTITCGDSTDAKKVTPGVFSFTTAGNRRSAGAAPSDGDTDWAPSTENMRGDWRMKGQKSTAEDLPPLQGRPGETSVSGRVLTLRGQPLSNVTLSIGTRQARTDQTGRFLLADVPDGHQVLIIDGRSATRPGATYGTFRAGVNLSPAQTNVLPFTIWMPKLDMVHAVTIPSPNQQEVVITNPLIPGLELHLPPGTVIRDLEGRAATQISITPVPTDRPPFPLPPGLRVPVFASIQPGGAKIIPPRARLIYPNYLNEAPGARVNFWNYDPEGKGWYIYGQGTVTPNGKQVVPDPGVVIYEFTGIMISSSGDPTSTWPPGGNGPGHKDGDPVDLSTGLFVQKRTDLAINDVLPLKLQRTYRPADTASRAFGIGTTHDYEMFLWSVNNYQELDLVLADGARIHYTRISSGTGFTDAVYEHTGTPSAFYKSRITWAGSSTWELKLKDGTVYVFPEYQPLSAIRDPKGNQITITRGVGGKITQVTSPNGRWIQFTYDTSSRVTQAKDNSGRTVGYQYDTSGRLWKVTDVAGGVTEYTYDSSHRMLTMKDARNIVFLTNEYNSADRVIKQTLADSTFYEFAYTLDGSGKVTQTDVTDPRGNVRRVTFNSSGYVASDTRALGETEEQTYTYTRQSGTNLITSITDPLDRVTAFTYDANGCLTEVTRLYGTTGAVTSTFTREPNFNNVASITDPLNHTVSFSYDTRGNLTTISDALSHQTTLSYNSFGQVSSLTDHLGHSVQLSYSAGDLVGITDPLSRTATRTVDAVGRSTSMSSASGHLTTFQYNALNQPTSQTNSLQGSTSLSYDANGNMLSVTDARSSVTSFIYNDMDRATTRRDPLSHDQTYEYDANGNMTEFTDREGQITSYSYDALNRLTGATYDDSSTTTYTYDAANRLTQLVDSLSGTYSYTYDDLDRLTQETTPQGSVSYSHDAAGRRTSMTVSGQSAVNYSYDNANRLTQISQGSATISMTYDNANRRTSLTLPNGVSTEYTWDAASQLTESLYKYGTNVLGNVTYSYDANGRRASMGGTFARMALPQAVTGNTYNAANHLTAFGSQSLSYDLNGNLTSDGTDSYTWDARRQLSSISGGASASFTYDSFGRRVSRTISSSTTTYRYDGYNIVQELSGSTPTANMLVGGMDEVFRRSDSSGSSGPLVDGVGSIIALSDSSGAVQTQYTYEPFGKTSVSGTTSSNSSQFTGRENDGTSLYYYRARYYSPTLQRFIAEDPLDFSGGDVNLYSYVRNSPATLIDPTGQATFEIGLGGSLRFGIGIVGSVTIAIDSSGNVGLTYTYGTGAGIAAQAQGGVLVHVSNANTINDLTGAFANASGSIGYGPDVAGDVFFGRNADGSPIIGGGATFGGGVGGGVSSTITNTGMIGSFNIPEVWRKYTAPPRPPNYPYDPTPQPAPYPTPYPPYGPPLPGQPGGPPLCPVCAPPYPPGSPMGMGGPRGSS
jgi:RHS repeat-associated protein